MQRRIRRTPGWENGKRTPVRTNSVGEAVHVRRERKGASRSEEKKKNGKHNPGKAQSINGCGAEVKYCSGSGQARFIFLARAWDERNCALKMLRTLGKRK